MFGLELCETRIERGACAFSGELVAVGGERVGAGRFAMESHDAIVARATALSTRARSYS